MNSGRRNSRKTLKGASSKKRDTTSSPIDPTLAQTVDFAKWCESFCSQASGKAVAEGMNALGPVDSAADVLISTKEVKPGTMLAAEQLGHMVDAWRYGSAAFTACLTNSNETAIHFAYYAELRAAMSLFAWSGLRVKQGEYFLLNSNGARVSMQTQKAHGATWGLWKEWIKRSDAQSLYLDGIRLHPQVKLRDVTKELRFFNNSSALTQWGADLVNVTLDHSARNLVSYNANWISRPFSGMAASQVNLVRELWSLLIDKGSGLLFDAALTSNYVKRTFESVNFQYEIDRLCDRIQNSTGVDKNAIALKLAGNYPSRAFKLAADEKSELENVLSRAFFLLRLSMLAVKVSISAIENKAALKWIVFWLSQVGLSASDPDMEPFDLSDDYSSAAENLSVTGPLPQALWHGDNLKKIALLIRPEACLAWGLQ